jgi:hypothetical protein
MEINIKIDISKKDEIKKGLLFFERLNEDNDTEQKPKLNSRQQIKSDIPEVPDDLKISLPEHHVHLDDYEEYKRLAEEKIKNPPKKKGFFRL